MEHNIPEEYKNTTPAKPNIINLSMDFIHMNYPD